MTGEKPPDIAGPKSGTRLDYPAGSPYARCHFCQQQRNPLFLATKDTHDWEGGDDSRSELCARCWSKYHREAEEECPHCGKRLDEEPLW